MAEALPRVPSPLVGEGFAPYEQRELGAKGEGANSPEFWMNLQAHYDLKTARAKLSAREEERIKASRAA